MKASKLATALAIAAAMTTAYAENAAYAASTSDDVAATAEADRVWYEAGEVAVQAEKGKAELERQGFQQYAP